MRGVKHKIELKLNSAGFKGREIEEILPDFMAERKTIVGITHYTSVEGPERWVLVVTLSIVFSNLAKAFLQELGKDLYGWSKAKLVNLFSRKSHAVGLILINIQDVELEYHVESMDRLLEFLERLPELVAALQPEQCRDWEAIVDDDGNWDVRPCTGTGCYRVGATSESQEVASGARHQGATEQDQ